MQNWYGEPSGTFVAEFIKDNQIQFATFDKDGKLLGNGPKMPEPPRPGFPPPHPGKCPHK